MSFAKHKPHVEAGDTVIVYTGYDSMFPITAEKGKITQTRYGALRHDRLIGCQYGAKFQCSKGYVYILHPTPELWTVSLPHRTQILYSTDIAVVTMQLDLKPGSVVCESGTGSASLSHAILRTIMPTGHLHTVEFHEKRAQTAREEFKTHGFGDIVTVYHRDVIAEGFPIENEADAVFLDIPRPYDAIGHAVKALKPGGRLCSFSPCIEQVQQTCSAIYDSRCFEDIETIELVHKPYNVRRISLPIVNLGMSDPEVHKTLSKILPCSYEPGNRVPVGEISAPENEFGTKSTNAQKRKIRSKNDENPKTLKTNDVTKVDDVTKEDSGKKDEFEESVPTPPSFTKSSFSARTCTAPKEIYGHTGYLTFATYSPS